MWPFFKCFLPLLSLLLASLSPGCAPEDPGEFALYLTRDPLQAFDESDLQKVILAPEPLLTIKDLTSYERRDHAMELTTEASRRLEGLDLPGQPFVLTVGGEPVYGGAFMAPYFSRTYDGVVILWPPVEGSPVRLHFQLGYPGSDFFSGQDPREDPRLIDALRQAGKLE